MALPVFKTEVFDSEGTLAVIDPRLSKPEEQSDVVYVSRLRNLNDPETPFILSDDEYQEVIDRVSFVLGLSEGEYMLLTQQVA